MTTTPNISNVVKNFIVKLSKPILLLYKGKIVYYTPTLPKYLDVDENILKEKTFTNIFKTAENEYLNLTDFLSVESENTEHENYKELLLTYINSKDKTIQTSTRIFQFEDNNHIFQAVLFSIYNTQNKMRLRIEELEKQNDLKTAFMANMSHELRTPLNSIIGFSELLLESDNTKEEDLLYRKMIGSSGRSLMQLIEDIIDTSKIESGQLKISKTDFELNAFMDEILFNFQQEKQIRELFNIDLHLSKASPEKELYIYTDQFRLRQVLSNLIVNSMKFTDTGFISFGYSFGGDNELQFYVKDSGTGMESDVSKKIFDRFSQDKSTQYRNKEGSGLGLSISKSIIKLLNGEIWLDTKSGVGTTFYFTIPFENKENTKSKNRITGRFDIPNLSEKKILVVDDVDQNIFFYKSLFKTTGANILVADTGKKAINICENNSDISLILMDIMMPDMDGYTTTREIKKMYPQLPIIMQTAFFSNRAAEQSFEAGADEFIGKPINIQELFTLVKKHI
ncbi:MAG: hybrid sensor histidine kinase/response regulator [Marinilabiliales bacterium]|nr:MAG: hybrid sensor histidine kinase/response regulator [Marinilabiliales bacterium]